MACLQDFIGVRYEARPRGDIELGETNAIAAADMLHRIDGEEWLARCSAQTRAIIERAGKLRSFADGESISRRGEVVEHLSIVLAGTIEVSISSYEGRRHVLGFVGAGQLVNLIPVMDGQVAIHDFNSHGPSELLMLSGDVFTDAAARDTDLSRYLLRLLCLRSRTLYDRLADTSLLSVRIRCSRTLLNLLPPIDAQLAGSPHAVHISQTEFADMVGASRQTVNQELRRLHDEGAITVGYSTLTINDVAALLASCHEVY